MLNEEVQEAIEESMQGFWQSYKDGYPITLGDKTIEEDYTTHWKPLLEPPKG